MPLWLDWALDLRVDSDLGRWTLGPVDLEAAGSPDGAERLRLEGRSLLTASTGSAFAGQVRAWL